MTFCNFAFNSSINQIVIGYIFWWYWLCAMQYEYIQLLHKILNALLISPGNIIIRISKYLIILFSYYRISYIFNAFIHQRVFSRKRSMSCLACLFVFAMCCSHVAAIKPNAINPSIGEILQWNLKKKEKERNDTFSGVKSGQANGQKWEERKKGNFMNGYTSIKYSNCLHLKRDMRTYVLACVDMRTIFLPLSLFCFVLFCFFSLAWYKLFMGHPRPGERP